MSGIRFSAPKTDRFNEVTFGRLSAGRSPNTFLTGMAPVKCDLTKILAQTDLDRNYEDPKNKSIAGRVFLPKDLANFRGTVIIANGVVGDTEWDWFKTRWEYLLKCLASNGFVAVAIRSTLNVTTRVAQFKGNITFLVDRIKTNHNINITTKHLALVGHSEASRAAAQTADDMTGLPFSKCRAVIVLGGSHQPGEYGKSFTTAFLAIHGSHDGDRKSDQGARMFQHVTGAQFRCHVWVHGATHNNVFQVGNSDLQNVNSKKYPLVSTKINLITQQIVTKNYIAMFLLWQLTGNSSFEPLFLGDNSLTVKADDDATQIVASDVDSGRLQCLPRYRRHPELGITGELCSLGDCYGLDDFLVGLEEKKPTFSILSNNFNVVCGDKGFLLRWGLAIRPTPKLFIVPPKDLVQLAPAVFEFDMAEDGNSSLNLSAPAVFKVEVNTSDGATRIRTFTVPKSASVASFNDKQELLANETMTVPSVIRVVFSSFGMATKDILKITFVALNFSSSNALGQIAITGFRYATK